MNRDVQPLTVFPAYDAKRKGSTGLRRLLFKLSPVPLHTLHPLLFEARLKLVRLRSRNVPTRFRDAEELLVNIGPGNSGRAGWVNVDIFEGEGVTCLYDCRKRLPFPDGSVRGIFTEHVVEHIDYTEEAPYFVSECHRVLEPGGTLRIVVPDAGRYLEAYCAGTWEPLEQLRELGPDHIDPHHGGRYATRMELVNAIFRQGFEHKFAYDYETLRYLLCRYGFEDVRQCAFGESALDALALDQPGRAAESLYVEAVK